MADDKKKNDNKKKDDKDQKSFKNYGFVKAFLDSHPQVKKKVKLAVKHGWTPDRLQGEVKTTTWWKTSTESQRKADLLSTSDPAQWNRMITTSRDEIRQQAEQMGLSLTTSELTKYAEQALRNGYSAQDITSWIAREGDYDQEQAKGNASIAIDELREMADSYGITLSPGTMNNYVRQILGGKTDMQGLTDVIREQAKVLYPSIGGYLDKGGTVKDYLSPYMEMASQELGLPVQQMSMLDTKWTAAINGNPDGAAMTQDQWMAKIRTDARYGWDKTLNAKQQVGDAMSQLLTLMKGS